MNYHPTHWFNRGLIKLYHEDKQPEIKSNNICGLDLTCRILEYKFPYSEQNKNDLILVEWIDKPNVTYTKPINKTNFAILYKNKNKF